MPKLLLLLLLRMLLLLLQLTLTLWFAGMYDVNDSTAGWTSSHVRLENLYLSRTAAYRRCWSRDALKSAHKLYLGFKMTLSS
jgi:hypothetical protein